MKRITALLTAAVLLCCAACAESLYEGATSVDSASYARLHDMELALEAVNGTYLCAGEVFSLEAVVGEQTRERGYLDAWDGKGLDQVAETLCGTVTAIPGVHFPSGGYFGGTALEFSAEDDLLIEMWLTDTQLCCRAEAIPCEEETADSEEPALFFGEPDAAEPAFFDGESGMTASASFPLEGTEALKNNVALAAESVKDTMLTADGVFSFNDTVGPRIEKFGYKAALNGRGVKVVGGGVAQVASVIWLAVKNLDNVAFIERSTYAENYNQHYVSGSSDAILTDYNAGTDFSFRYTGSGQMTIYTYIADGCLCCDIYEN